MKAEVWTYPPFEKRLDCQPAKVWEGEIPMIPPVGTCLMWGDGWDASVKCSNYHLDTGVLIIELNEWLGEIE